MARARKQQNDEGLPGPAAWVVTFSDVMMLLLCFFVLLVTFSSFEPVELSKLLGSFRYDTFESVFPGRKTPLESMVLPQPGFNVTKEGSERPTDFPPQLVKNPKLRRPVVDVDAYKDLKVFNFKSKKLFWAKGSRLTDEGRRHLHDIAAFIRLVPCQVIIGESGPLVDLSTDHQGGTERAWSIREFFVETERLEGDRFHITARPALAGAPTGGRMVEIAMLGRKIY